MTAAPEIKHTATLYMLCGKMAAGKSTLAQQLAKREHLILLSEDEWLATLYPGEIIDLATYANRSTRIKTAIEQLLVSLLSKGMSVVMDFPANTAAQRAWLCSLAVAAQANHELHLIDLPDSTCKVQLLKRARENPERAQTDTLKMFEAVTAWFEYPGEHEGLNIVRVNPTDHA
jgi:predicted kinase